MLKIASVLGLVLLCHFSTSASCLSGNCSNGQGVYTDYQGNKYSGQFKNGRAHGKGIMKYARGDKYLGYWYLGKKQGKGKLIIPNVGNYIGEFSNDKITGKGIFEYANGEKYEGQWKNGLAEGYGVYTYAEGRKREGQWQAGVLAQEATPEPSGPKDNIATHLNKPNLEYLEDCNTHYCHDMRGQLTYTSGSIYTGEFRNGNPEGQGRVVYADGNIYEGMWKNHAPNGEGTLTLASGQVAHGQWNNGKLLKNTPVPSILAKPTSQPDYNDEIKVWAVVVGVAAYNSMTSLKYTDDDAYKVYAFLKSPEGGALPDEQIQILVDDSATKNSILASMSRLFNQADENDIILMYYSGHGLEGSFIPYDFDGYNNRLMHEEIKEIFDQSKAKQKICFADACYSGSIASARNAGKATIDSYYKSFQNIKSGTAMLMSSAQNEVSLEFLGLRQGIFSHFLIRGLKGEADRNHNSIVTIDELYKFVYSGVRQYTNNSQSPILIGNYDRNMPLSVIRK